MFNYYNEYKKIDETYKDINTQINYIISSKNRDEIVFYSEDNYTGEYNIFRTFSLCGDTDKAWINQWFAKYYNVKSIIMKKPNE